MTKIHNILLIEDTDAHANLIIRTMKKHQIANQIFHVTNGEQALKFLHHEKEFDNETKYPQPDLILLDLRIPRIDGLEVLRQIKTDESLKFIPTVILTTSAAEKDVLKAYEFHANSYLVKPVNFDAFSELLQDLGWYWGTRNQLPRA